MLVPYTTTLALALALVVLALPLPQSPTMTLPQTLGLWLALISLTSTLWWLCATPTTHGPPPVTSVLLTGPTVAPTTPTQLSVVPLVAPKTLLPMASDTTKLHTTPTTPVARMPPVRQPLAPATPTQSKMPTTPTTPVPLAAHDLSRRLQRQYNALFGNGQRASSDHSVKEAHERHCASLTGATNAGLRRQHLMNVIVTNNNAIPQLSAMEDKTYKNHVHEQQRVSTAQHCLYVSVIKYDMAKSEAEVTSTQRIRDEALAALTATLEDVVTSVPNSWAAWITANNVLGNARRLIDVSEKELLTVNSTFEEDSHTAARAHREWLTLTEAPTTAEWHARRDKWLRDADGHMARVREHEQRVRLLKAEQAAKAKHATRPQTPPTRAMRRAAGAPTRRTAARLTKAKTPPGTHEKTPTVTPVLPKVPWLVATLAFMDATMLYILNPPNVPPAVGTAWAALGAVALLVWLLVRLVSSVSPTMELTGTVHSGVTATLAGLVRQQPMTGTQWAGAVGSLSVNQLRHALTAHGRVLPTAHGKQALITSLIEALNLKAVHQHVHVPPVGASESPAGTSAPTVDPTKACPRRPTVGVIKSPVGVSTAPVDPTKPSPPPPPPATERRQRGRQRRQRWWWHCATDCSVSTA